MNTFFNCIKKILFKFDKLYIKSLIIMVLSIFLSYFTVGIMSMLIYPRINFNTKGEFIFFEYAMVFIIIIIFLIFYSFGVNLRIKYLKYIVNHLKEIENINYLENVKIKGNDEITILAKSINIMLDRLKENYNYEKRIEEEKNELIVSVSHDIKTPLTSIIGYLELLKKEKSNQVEKKHYIDLVYKKSLTLKKIVSELFEYSKLNNNYIIIKKVNFNVPILINQIVGEYIAFFERKNIIVKIISSKQKIYHNIDVTKIVRVIENIVDNANKYSFNNTIFKIFIEKENNNTKIIFHNKGESIENHLDKIFKKMYRVDKSRSSENEGSGLGLAISKKIIELHGGKLWAECKDNDIKFIILL